MPWGVAVDDEGMILVSDWRNDRIQRFTPDGDHLMSFGSSGSGNGQLNRPAGIEVDFHGDIYVSDRGNNRIQLFDPNGRYVRQFTGDATLSKIGRIYIQNNVSALRARETVSTEQEKKFVSPPIDANRSGWPDVRARLRAGTGCRYTRKRRTGWPRAEIAAPRNSPTLYTV